MSSKKTKLVVTTLKKKKNVRSRERLRVGEKERE